MIWFLIAALTYPNTDLISFKINQNVIFNTEQECIEYLQTYKLTPTGTTNASTFQTQARTATSVPTTVRLVLLGKEEQTQTLNTDTVFQISRNNASNFSAITMTESGTYNSAGVKIYTGTLDVSSQPSGSQIVLKMTTTATKGFTLHGYSILYK